MKFAVLGIWIMSTVTPVLAEDGAAVAPSGPDAVNSEVQAGQQLDQVVKESETSKSAAKSTKKGRKRGQGSSRDKDAEGTEAPNRFEADPVIHSRYHQSGQPLEVDPD